MAAWSASLVGVSESHRIVEKFESTLTRRGYLIIANSGESMNSQRLVEEIAQQERILNTDYGVYSEE